MDSIDGTKYGEFFPSQGNTFPSKTKADPWNNSRMPARSDIVEVVRRNIQARIDDSKSSRTAVSRASGLNESAIRYIMKGGKRGPTISSLQAVADQFGCTVADLVTEGQGVRTESALPDESIEAPITSMQQHEKGFMRLHVNQVVTVGQFMEIMAILQREDEEPSDEP